MPIHRYKASAKSTKTGKSRKDILPSALRWTTFFLGAVYLGWTLLFPTHSGVIGRALSDKLFQFVGAAAYLLPIFLFNGLIQHALRGKASGWMVTTLASILGFAAGAALFAKIGFWAGADAARAGGAWGAALSSVLTAGMGGVGALLIALGALLFALQIVFEIRWSQVAAAAGRLLAADYAAWSQARAALKVRKSKAVSQEEAVKIKSSDPQAAAKADGAGPPKPVDTRALKPLIETAGLPKLIEEKRNGKPKPADGAARPAPPAPTSAYKNYRLPSLELLSLPSDARRRGKPTEAELSTAIADSMLTILAYPNAIRVT